MSSLSTGPWLAPPSAEDRTRFHLHVLETGRPETFRGVRVAEGKPPVDGTAVYVCGFYANPKKRGEDRVPCSICSEDHPKFFEGGLVWAPPGYLYLVGHRCARRHFGADRYQSMRTDTLTGTRLGQADAFLISERSIVGPLRDHIEELRPGASLLERHRDRLRSNLPKLVKALLRSAKDHGGRMVFLVDPTLRGDQSHVSRSARSISSALPFAAFKGLRLIGDERFTPAENLETLLAGLPPAQLNADTMEGYLRGLTEAQRLTLAKNLENAPKAMNRLVRHMHDAAQFLTKDNLGALAEWTVDQRSAVRFEVRLQNSLDEVYEIRSMGENMAIKSTELQFPQCPVEEF